MKIWFQILLMLAAGWGGRLAAQPTIDFITTNNLVEPFGVAVDEANNYFVTDSATHRIIKYNSDNGQLIAFAGVSEQSGTNNGPGFIARFFSPKGIILARGGLIVADSGNQTLRFLTVTGSVAAVANFAGSIGVPGAAVAGPIPLDQAQFNAPTGLAVDKNGNIYVADAKNNAIRKITPDNQVTTIGAGFAEPSSVTADDQGNVYVADTRNHAIKIIRPDGTVELLAGSSTRAAGTNDSFFATGNVELGIEPALFRSPNGVIWVGGTIGLLVSDTGNHALRRVYFDPVIEHFFPELNGYGVQTYAGKPGQSGFQDGLLSEALFNSPMGLARDTIGGLLLADLGNQALRRIQTTPRLPRVSNPVLGRIEMVVDEDTGKASSKLFAVTDEIFNNEIRVGALTEAGTETFFTFGDTPGLFEPDNIPTPNSTNSLSPPPYRDGLSESELPTSMIATRPDVTIKAISTAPGRRPSEMVTARFQFKTATPLVNGDNAASFVVSCGTTGAQIWYTVDGTEPNNGLPSLGPVSSGSTLSLQITNAITFKARAFKPSFQPSKLATKIFYPDDFQANRITLGFEAGEASSDFVASPGQRFIAPVTLSLLSGARMYGLQFNLSVSNLNASPAVSSEKIGFQSMLLARDTTVSPPVYRIMPPQMFLTFENQVTDLGGGIFVTNRVPVFRNLITNNVTLNLLSVGWFETFGEVNLYNTFNQDLISFSQAHNNRLEKAGGKVIVGGFRFDVPTSAAPGDVYRIQVGRPSATGDGIAEDVFIQAPTNGSLTIGALNSIKHVTVGQRRYLVGDSAPFRWFNAGDFGDTNLLNNDLSDLFQTVTYGLNSPMEHSDFFDAMDSSNGGRETLIDNIKLGDKVLGVDDLFVTYRRSFDPTLKWYARFWSNGVQEAVEVPNRFRGQPNAPAEEFALPLATASAPSGLVEPPSAFFYVGLAQAQPGTPVQIPIRADIRGPRPAKVLLMNVTLEPVNGAPPLTEAVQFSPNPALGSPTYSGARGLGNYAAAWLNASPSAPGLLGATTLGTLTVPVPDEFSINGAYRVRLEKVSASPNGVWLMPQQAEDGWLVHNQSPRPIQPRLRMLSSVRLDAEGKARGVSLRWTTLANRKYRLERSATLNGPAWTAVVDQVGDGSLMEFQETTLGATCQFYRVIESN